MRAPRTLLALLVAVGMLLGVPAAAPDRAAVLGADTDLTLVTDAAYVVDPVAAAVHVTVDIAARNNRAETATKRFYFDRAFLAILPGVTGLKVTGPTKPSVSVTKRTAAYTMVRINFGDRLYNGKATTFRLTFDIPDPGSPPEREVRVGDSLVSFPIWAFASDGASGSKVSVSFPAGYAVTFESGTMSGPETGADGTLVFRSATLSQPLTFFAYVVAEREGSVASVPLSVPVGDDAVAFELRAWADDPAWATRVGDLFTRGLPLLAEDIGLPWPHDGTGSAAGAGDPFVVEEAISRSAGGYAGQFDPDERRIEIAYWASPGVVLHEAAHGWFNGALLGDRWANEGFASLYASRAATALELDPGTVALTDEILAAKVPLNAWGPAATADAATETYGFAASLELARLVAERAGDDVLREVWARAADGVGAYPDPRRASEPPARVDSAPDWRGLLDLLEDATGTSFDDLWRTWVVRDEERELLDTRREARLSLARTQALAGGWALPPQVRQAMRAWQFDTAEGILADARTVLAQRTAVEDATRATGLVLPDTVRELFERGALAEASSLAAIQLSAIDVVSGAAAYRPADPDPLTTIGLLGSDPDATLSAARAALAAGSVEAALADAQLAQRTWTDAWEEGRRRGLLAIAVITAVLLLAGTLIGRVRRQRAAPAATPPASDEATPSR